MKSLSRSRKGGKVASKREKHVMKDNHTVKLPQGTVVWTAKDKYTISTTIGAGGFGEVYLVVKESTSKTFAMKTEIMNSDIGMNRLHVEKNVLLELKNLPPANRKHFVELIDMGQTISPPFKHIVMSLVHDCIENIREFIIEGKEFSKSTAHRFAIQSLEAVGDLHRIGYIHRDLKPANFAVGVPPNDDVIYLLDFGISRKYVENGSRTLRTPREKVRFIGTTKYASRACHRKKEQSRKDDLESWLYTVMDVFWSQSLPWRKMNREDVLAMKERYFANPETNCPDLFKFVPQGYRRIIRYINILNYDDIPDYDFMGKSLDKIRMDENILPNAPFDWQGKLGKDIYKPPKSEKIPKGQEAPNSNMAFLASKNQISAVLVKSRISRHEEHNTAKLPQI